MTFTPASWGAQQVVNFANKPFRSQEKGAELTAAWGAHAPPSRSGQFYYCYVEQLQKGRVSCAHYVPLAACSVMASVVTGPHPAH